MRNSARENFDTLYGVFHADHRLRHPRRSQPERARLAAAWTARARAAGFPIRRSPPPSMARRDYRRRSRARGSTEAVAGRTPGPRARSGGPRRPRTPIDPYARQSVNWQARAARRAHRSWIAGWSPDALLKSGAGALWDSPYYFMVDLAENAEEARRQERRARLVTPRPMPQA